MTDNTLISYPTSDGLSRFVLRELDGQLWLTQAEIAELYQTTKQNISKHIKAIFDENELVESLVVNCELTTAGDGKNYQTLLYSFPMIIAIGYCVRSTRGRNISVFRLRVRQKKSKVKAILPNYCISDLRNKHMKPISLPCFSDGLKYPQNPYNAAL